MNVIRAAFFGQSKRPANPVFSYGMLAAILGLLVFDIRWRLNLPPRYPYERNEGLVVGLMLLFNHLAFQFRWPARVNLALRILAFGWVILGLFYTFSYVLPLSH